jgi:peroxiredoxin
MSGNAMTLRQRLAAMMSVRPPAYRALLDAVTLTLRDNAIEQILRPGDRLPDFVLPDAQGNIVFSGELLARGPLVVVFFRGSWCPFCNETLTALDQILPEITAAGASLVALTFDTGDYVASDWQGLQLHFPVLSDVDGGTALTFGTMFRVPDALRAFYEKIGIDIGVRHGDETWFLPIPATFVADRTGIVRYVHASGDITDRMEPRDIMARVREVASIAATD